MLEVNRFGMDSIYLQYVDNHPFLPQIRAVDEGKEISRAESGEDYGTGLLLVL